MIVGIDIDDTITACVPLFRILTKSVKDAGGEVHIISSRSDTPEVLRATKDELDCLKISYDYIFLLPDRVVAEKVCLHRELDWYQKFIWQKVQYCKDKKVSLYFDDEGKVIELFQKYAPEIQLLRVIKNSKGED
jgi:hypothetical protein